MVNFRFHIVSLVAVFLALSLGIGMGATVIDKATVDRLQQSLDSVRNEVSAANQRSDELQRELNRSNDFQNQSSAYLVNGALRNQSVVVVAVRGADETPIEDTRELIKSSGANVSGTLWFTSRNTLDDNGVLSSLREDLEIPSADTNQIRQAVLARVAAVMAGASDGASLEPLLDAGVVNWQPDAANTNIATMQFGGSKIVFASGAQPEIANDLIARPFVRLLASQPTRRVVAIESGRESNERTSAERAVFVGTLRNDNDIEGRISTVDHIETVPGRAATVLALQQLPDAVGDYGTGSGATDLIPKLR